MGTVKPFSVELDTLYFYNIEKNRLKHAELHNQLTVSNVSNAP